MIGINLSGRVVLITGASQGLGLVMARRFHEAGASVAINHYPDPDGTNRRNAEAAVSELGDRAAAFAGDVTNRDALPAMFDAIAARFGGLDVVVNNAGILRDRTAVKMSPGEWDSVIATNLTGVFNVCQLAAARLRDGGRIVNLGSIAASLGFFGQTNYAAAKAGVEGMSRALSREVARRGITVNVVAPGVVLTDMGKSIPEAVRAKMIEQIPLGRFGEPQDIADAVLFLASDLSRYITAQTLHVSGGWHM